MNYLESRFLGNWGTISSCPELCLDYNGIIVGTASRFRMRCILHLDTSWGGHSSCAVTAVAKVSVQPKLACVKSATKSHAYIVCKYIYIHINMYVFTYTYINAFFVTLNEAFVGFKNHEKFLYIYIDISSLSPVSKHMRISIHR